MISKLGEGAVQELNQKRFVDTNLNSFDDDENI